MANSFSAYIDRDSYIHRFNPSLKLIILVMFVVMVFLPIGFFGQTILLIVLIIGWCVAKLPFRTMWAIIKSCVVMFLILFFINWLAYKDPGLVAGVDDGGSILSIFHMNWWETLNAGGSQITLAHGTLWGGQTGDAFWRPSSSPYVQPSGWSLATFDINGGTLYLPYQTSWYTLSSETIVRAAYITFKIFLMIGIVTLIISSTNPVQLSFAIEDILNPLHYVRIPVNEWAMTISIALRFVPSLLEESQKVMRAQASRGVDFNNGNVKDKVKSLVSLVVPMFSIAFHKADDLANAMEARAYNPRYTRTRYRSYSINSSHWVVASVVAILLGFFIMFVAKNMLFAPFGWSEALLMFGK
ncbi:MAG: energy-coupling factor transporter transmembrane protein EcfT [Mycoplasmataceae bacterium]|nr:energy-coupling factor transporter transmembrane protein EcfT [Mycoplasmataceae bacterium]